MTHWTTRYSVVNWVALAHLAVDSWLWSNCWPGQGWRWQMAICRDSRSHTRDGGDACKQERRRILSQLHPRTNFGSATRRGEGEGVLENTERPCPMLRKCANLIHSSYSMVDANTIGQGKDVSTSFGADCRTETGVALLDCCGQHRAELDRSQREMV